MPNFRLNDEQIKAISAYVWQSALADPCPSTNRETRLTAKSCLKRVAAGMSLHRRGRSIAGRTFAANLTRVGEKDSYDYLVRWVHNARERTRPYCPYEKKDIGPEDYKKKGLPYIFDWSTAGARTMDTSCKCRT